jgi:tetratricopeptide (TPR) repeat protein
MKKNVLILLLAASSACAVQGQNDDHLKKHYLKTYGQALYYNDINAAINALHGYIAIDSNVAYKDTLSMLYFRGKSYVSALLLAEDVSKVDPNNIQAISRTAECYDQLGEPKTAITLYEKVVASRKDPYNMYKLAVCQYQLKRIGECEATAKAVLTDTSSAKTGVLFTMEDGTQQAVPVSAATMNLLGVLKMETKNYAGAKADFQKALTFFPEFAGAKGNLEVCDKNLKGVAKPPAKTPVKPR